MNDFLQAGQRDFAFPPQGRDRILINIPQGIVALDHEELVRQFGLVADSGHLGDLAADREGPVPGLRVAFFTLRILQHLVAVNCPDRDVLGVVFDLHAVNITDHGGVRDRCDRAFGILEQVNSVAARIQVVGVVRTGQDMKTGDIAGRLEIVAAAFVVHGIGQAGKLQGFAGRGPVQGEDAPIAENAADAYVEDLEGIFRDFVF